MRKRSSPKRFILPFLLGINLLTTNLLSTDLPALADTDTIFGSDSADATSADGAANVKDGPAGSTATMNRGLSGQSAAAGGGNLQTYNGLPVTNLDSFVYQAGAMADQIYGDESFQGVPEFSDGFTASHRINAGIVGVNDAGLTTGHGAVMPCAWGADEFLAAPGEWCQSGPSSGFNAPGVQTGGLGGLIEQAAGYLANQVFSQVPNALGSVGTASASGLGRVMGMPFGASISGLPGLPSVSAAISNMPNPVNYAPTNFAPTPALPQIAYNGGSGSAQSGLQLTVPLGPGVTMTQTLPSPGTLPGPGNLPGVEMSGAVGGGSLSAGLNLSDLSSGVGGF